MSITIKKLSKSLISSLICVLFVFSSNVFAAGESQKAKSQQDTTTNAQASGNSTTKTKSQAGV